MSQPPQNLSLLLADGIEQLGLKLDANCQQSLLSFIEQLQKWNKIYSLSAIRNLRQSVTHHLLDSLALIPFLHGPRILDVGTGPGIPGIPLALACPDREFFLLDSNGKKTRFITQAKIQLGIKNVQVVHARVEQFHAEEHFTTLITRAFGSMQDTLALTNHLICEGSHILLMKSRDAATEFAQQTEGYEKQLKQLSVPFLDAERNVIQLVKQPSVQ